MGWIVLYTAFGIVAVWLLGEVLLQYKARLRWRVLAFVGFSAVVLGVAVLSSVVVIALGAMAFAVGQTFVTLSYRRGFSTGWALGGKPGSSRRRRELEPEPPEAEPVLEVTELRTYEPEQMVEETGEYGVYDRGDSYPPGQDIYAEANQQQYADQQYADQPQFAGQAQGQPLDGAAYAYDGQQQYAAYSDPYIGYDSGQFATAAYGTGGYDTGARTTASYGYDDTAAYGSAPYGYDPQGHAPQAPQYAPEAAAHGSDGYGVQYSTGQYDQYNQYEHYQYPHEQHDQYDQYGQPYPQYGQNPGYDAPYGHDAAQQQGHYSQTPPGGVWVPQQREAHEPSQNGQPYPYQNGAYPAGDGYWQPESPRAW